MFDEPIKPNRQHTHTSGHSRHKQQQRNPKSDKSSKIKPRRIPIPCTAVATGGQSVNSTHQRMPKAYHQPLNHRIRFRQINKKASQSNRINPKDTPKTTQRRPLSRFNQVIIFYHSKMQETHKRGEESLKNSKPSKSSKTSKERSRRSSFNQAAPAPPRTSPPPLFDTRAAVPAGRRFQRQRGSPGTEAGWD